MSKNKWKIAFWLSCLVLGGVSGLVLLTWFQMMGSNAPMEPEWVSSEWVSYFHPFPLSLILSLIIWLYLRAFWGPVRYTRKWLIAFFVNCVPSGALYVLSVNTSFQLQWVGREAYGYEQLFLWFLEAIALFLLGLQVWFAIRAFK